MSDSNRGYRDQTVAGAFGVLALLGAVILAFAIGNALGINSGRDQVTAREHYENTKQNNLRTCTGREGPAAIECVTEAIESAQDQSDSRQDLYAQQDMAKWAFWLLMMTFITLGVTALGVFFVKRTLDATYDALEDTGNATKAMVRQNELTENAQRPWIAIGAELLKIEVNENSIWVEVKTTFSNVGKMAAENFYGKTQIIPMGEPFLAHMKEWFDKFEIEEEMQYRDTVVIPGDSYTGISASGNAIAWLPWARKEGYREDCYFMVLVMARYRISKEDKWRYSMKGFSVGENINHLDNRKIIRESIQRLTMDNVIIQPLGRSRAT